MNDSISMHVIVLSLASGIFEPQQKMCKPVPHCKPILALVELVVGDGQLSDEDVEQTNGDATVRNIREGKMRTGGDER